MFLRRRKGFTLIELLIVVAIIGVLAGIAIPNFLSARTKAKVSRSFADMRNVANGLEMAYLDTTTYPDDPLKVINAISGYVSSVPGDPFNTAGTARTAGATNTDAIANKSYGYSASGNTSWLLLSNGPDNDQDIVAGDLDEWGAAYRLSGNIGGDEPVKTTAGNDPYGTDEWAATTTDTTGDIGRGGP